MGRSYRVVGSSQVKSSKVKELSEVFAEPNRGQAAIMMNGQADRRSDRYAEPGKKGHRTP